MHDLFAGAGMTSVSVIVIMLEILSLLAMSVVLLAFSRARRKQTALFRTLHDAPVALERHTVLVWVYVVMTIGIGLASMYLFVFQPHLL